jgi:hypothetical protein
MIKIIVLIIDLLFLFIIFNYYIISKEKLKIISKEKLKIKFKEYY